MSIVLKNRVEASDRSADELEAIFSAHRLAMLRFDLRDQVKDVTDLFHSINADVERWQTFVEVSPKHRDESGQLDAEWHGLYQRLNRTYAKTFRLVVAMEREGHEVEGKAEFLNAWKELRGIVSVTLENVAAGVAQIQSGQFKPLAEVRRELWDSPVVGSAERPGPPAAAG